MTLRLFVLGLPKAGTSTLQKAMEAAGLSSVHWYVVLHGRVRFVGEVMEKAFDDGRDPVADLPAECVTQADACWPEAGLNYWPQMNIPLLERLRADHPSAVFVLNTRDVTAHIASISGWRNNKVAGYMRDRLTDANIRGLPAGKGARDDELRRWIEGHYAEMREFFAGDPHFVEFDIADAKARDRLSDALGVHLPWWGVENARKVPA